MIKLGKPYINNKEINAVTKVLKSGNYVQGEWVNKFENEIAKYLKVKYVSLVSSGTAALHIALISLNIQEGDEIIVPAYTFPAAINVIELCKAKPTFVDIKLDDFCIDVDQIENKITKKTKAIIGIDEFGNPCNSKKILSLCKKYNLKYIEDAACSLGSKEKEFLCGTKADISCFSLHPRKIITTGEGGIIVTNDAKLDKKIKLLRSHGMVIINNKRDFELPGFNYRMTEIQAAMGFEQLKKIKKIISTRQKQGQIYNNAFKNHPYINTYELDKNTQTNYQTYQILLNKNINREKIIDYLKKMEIESGPGAQAINYLSYYRNKYKLTPNSFPNASIAHEQGLAIPIGNNINKKNQDFIIDALKKFFD